MTEYKPDLAKIAKPLQSLWWMPIDPAAKWWDETVLLVAVRIGNPDDWRYDYAVVDIVCDEYGVEVYCEDEVWDRNLDDADWYVVISDRWESAAKEVLG